MSYTDRTIKWLVDSIESDEIILPAIQRNFVWSTDKVKNLFDSLLNEYPIGTFLFWQVNKDRAEGVAFNKFRLCHNKQLIFKAFLFLLTNQNIPPNQQDINGFRHNIFGFHRPLFARCANYTLSYPNRKEFPCW